METAIDGFQGRAVTWTTPTACSPPPSTTPATATPSTAPRAGDYKIDQGVAITSRDGLLANLAAPYVPAVQEHDVGSVMPSFSSVDWTEDGVGNPIKMHAHRELITGVLKGDARLRRLRDQRLGGHPPDRRGDWADARCAPASTPAST